MTKLHGVLQSVAIGFRR